tara:strand:+ start:92 stop:274 length:183 start_codon:yes stop_codon:yes gene_type:complete
MMDGLHIKNGRLINDRPDGETGIARAARIKKAMKEQDKINMIADGIERAEVREKLRNMMF